MKIILALFFYLNSAFIVHAQEEIDFDFDCTPSHSIIQNFAPMVIVATPHTAAFIAGVAAAAAHAIKEWHDSQRKPKGNDRYKATYTYQEKQRPPQHMYSEPDPSVVKYKEDLIRQQVESRMYAKAEQERKEKQAKTDKIYELNGIDPKTGELIPDAQNPKAIPKIYRPIKGQKGKLNTKTCEVWEPDMLHKDHWEVYKDLRRYLKDKKRDRAVYENGKLKVKF